MGVSKLTFAAASCSWINPATGLPETDAPILAPTLPRSFFTGSRGFRFCNFLEAWVQLDGVRRTIVAAGFTGASGIYRSPSFLHIPSHAFKTLQEKSPAQNVVRFTQIAGARTVTAEVAGASVGAAVGSVVFGAPGAVAGGLIGEGTAHQVMNFPPIWSKVQMTVYADARCEAALLQHSLFPSLTFYTQTTGVSGTVIPLFARTNLSAGVASYDGRKTPELADWHKRGWGLCKPANGPSGGNPWGIAKGILGGSENVPD